MNHDITKDQFFLKQGVSFLKNYIKEKKWNYMGGFMILILLNIISVMTPILTGHVVDAIKNAVDGIQDLTIQRLTLYASLFVLISLVSLIANFVARLFFIGSNNMLDYLLRKKMFQKLIA